MAGGRLLTFPLILAQSAALDNPYPAPRPKIEAAEHGKNIEPVCLCDILLEISPKKNHARARYIGTFVVHGVVLGLPSYVRCQK